MMGLNSLETEASCIVVYAKALPDTAGGAWDNAGLATSDIHVCPLQRR